MFVPPLWGIGAEAFGNVALEDGLQVGSKIYRVFGNEARIMGRYWTDVAPDSVENYRAVAGLPTENSGSFIAEGQLNSMEGVVQGPVAAIGENPGGLSELFISNPEEQVTINRISGLNPPL